MKIESWREKFFKLAELYLESDGIVWFVCGQTGKSYTSIKSGFYSLTEKQQEGLQTTPRYKVGDIIDGRQEDVIKTKLVDPHKILAYRKSRKQQIAKKVLEVE